MGQYWSDGNAVEVDQRVINYLRRAKEPKTLSQIVARGQITGRFVGSVRVALGVVPSAGQQSEL